MRHQDSPPAARVAQLAARQHGVVSHRQLVAAGLSSEQVARWARAGHVHRLHRGVFAVGHANVTREGRYVAALLAAGEGAVLSHLPAARHLRIDLKRGAGPIHLSVPRSRRPTVPGIWIHRPRLLGPVDILTRDRIRTTTHTRTLFDLSPLVIASTLRDLFERAEYLDELDRGRLRNLLDTTSGHKGARDLRVLLDYEPLPLNRVRSQLEGIVLSTCRTHSLPIPAVNVPLLGFEVDFLWERQKLVVEADGGRHVGERRERDNERDLILQRAGYLVRRYGESALAHPARIAAELAALIRERTRTDAPPGGR